MAKVSILIPVYNMEDTIAEALDSCIAQDYPQLEIIVGDNHSEDHTVDVVDRYPQVILEKSLTNIGAMNNLNKLINKATGDYIVFLCADDYFTNNHVVSDMVKVFEEKPGVGYVGRYYYQFIDKKPVRAFRSNNPYRQADNWSGIAFRSACRPFSVSQNIFVEAADTVKQVLAKGWDYYIIPYDTVAVRTTIGKNGSQHPDCYKKSPTKNWIDLIGWDYETLTNFISLVQIKNWGTYKELLREAFFFVRYKPSNLFRIDFWFFFLTSLLTPKIVLKWLVNFYKLNIGSLLTKEIKRG